MTGWYLFVGDCLQCDRSFDYCVSAHGEPGETLRVYCHRCVMRHGPPA